MSSGSSSGRTWAMPLTSARVMPLSGEPWTENFPAASSMSSGAASSAWATIARAFAATLSAARATDSVPTAVVREP